MSCCLLHYLWFPLSIAAGLRSRRGVNLNFCSVLQEILDLWSLDWYRLWHPSQVSIVFLYLLEVVTHPLKSAQL